MRFKVFLIVSLLIVGPIAGADAWETVPLLAIIDLDITCFIPASNFIRLPPLNRITGEIARSTPWHFRDVAPYRYTRQLSLVEQLVKGQVLRGKVIRDPPASSNTTLLRHLIIS